MVAQPIESTTISPAVNALRRFFLAEGQVVLPTEHAEAIHAWVVGNTLIECMRDRPTLRPDRAFGLAPGSAAERKYRRLAGAWLERAQFIRHEARTLGKDGRARLQAWLDAGCPWAVF